MRPVWSAFSVSSRIVGAGITCLLAWVTPREYCGALVTTLSLETREEQDTVRIAVAGELDLSSALTFDDEVRRAEERKPTTLILDLRRLRFMDSTGLRLIMNAQSRAAKRGWRLAIVLGSEPVRRIFRLAGVTRRLDIVDHPSAVVSGPAA